MITLSNLHEHTAQQVFDYVVEGLRKQGRKSRDEVKRAFLYRGPDGLRCAAGMLISDEEYVNDMEFHRWVDLVVRDIVPKNHDSLISDLQDVHDNDDNDDIENWERGFERTATKFNLVYTPKQEQP